jgi:hypothetical protein
MIKRTSQKLSFTGVLKISPTFQSKVIKHPLLWQCQMNAKLGLQWLHIGNITWLRNVASQLGKTEKHQIGLNNEKNNTKKYCTNNRINTDSVFFAIQRLLFFNTRTTTKIFGLWCKVTVHLPTTNK